MQYLHEAQLANAVTGLTICAVGLWSLVYTAILTPRQPWRWLAVYFMIFVSGIPAVAYHAFGETRLLSSLDTGGNLLVMWVMHIALGYDFVKPSLRKPIIAISTIVNAGAILYMANELRVGERIPTFDIRDFGSIYAGEVVLILDGWAATMLLVANLQHIPRSARPLLYFTFVQFFFAMLLASANSNVISFRILAWHASWHLLAAFGMLTFWLFNHVRFKETGDASG